MSKSRSKSKSRSNSSTKKKRKREDENETESSLLPSSEGEPNDRRQDPSLKEAIAETKTKPDDKSSHGNKRQKKKRKKRAIHNVERQSSPKEGNDKGGDRSLSAIKTTGNSSPVLKQQQQQDNDQTLETSTRLVTESRHKKKRKKKKKKRAPQEQLTTNNDDDGDGGVDDANGTNNNDNVDDEVVLEGSMISDIFVLIDRKGGKVYSATEQRLENGERKLVGRLDEKGGVVLFPKNEQLEKDLEPSSEHNNDDDSDRDDKNGDPHKPSSGFPFEVDPDDHCESPLEAYEDIVPLLQSYRRRIRSGKESSKQLSIYDPYFCNGRVARQLESLGFPEIYNRKEDCYEVWNDSSLYPSYEVFLTNPPYSADHIEKLMQHVTSKKNQNKPWMLLMPNFVHKKDYFQKLTANAGQLPIYLVPKKRYIYLPPPTMREKKASSTHKKSSPFVSMWYLWGGSRDVTNEWYRVLVQKQQQPGGKLFDVARSKSGLRDLRRKPKK